MSRSTRQAGYVNSISFDELKAVLGENFEDAIRTGLQGLFSEIGLKLAEAIIEGEVQNLCGPKHSRKEDGQAVRWGSQRGTITVRGVKEGIKKPRVRTVDGKEEIDLETYSALNSTNALNDELIAKVSSGVSTREFAKTISKHLKATGISKSSVSRKVIENSQKALEGFNQRRWDKAHFVALLFDGISLGETHVVVAVGIDRAGRKHILGWQLGSTEHEVVCRDLIRKLIECGLNPDGAYLFVIDGSKALRKAIRLVFGNHSVIQRCQEHKIRDVEGYLPYSLRKTFRIKLQTAFNQTTYKKAALRLQKLRNELLNISEPAANSLTEGLEELLTLHKLGINGGVRESLRTTNIIESAFARVRANARHISNWTDTAQVERWLGLIAPKVEKGFRRLPGFRQLAKLGKAVKAQIALHSSKA